MLNLVYHDTQDEKVYHVVSRRLKDKFDTFGLTPVPAKKIKAPLIAECLANIECQVTDVSLVRKYTLFILKPVKAWIDAGRKERRTIHHNGDGTFVVDGRVLNLKKKMVKWPDFL